MGYEQQILKVLTEVGERGVSVPTRKFVLMSSSTCYATASHRSRSLNILVVAVTTALTPLVLPMPSS